MACCVIYTELHTIMNIKELLQQSQRWHFEDLTDQILDVADAVVFCNAPVSEAQEAICNIADELDCLIEQSKLTPTEQDLACKFGGFECEGCE